MTNGPLGTPGPATACIYRCKTEFTKLTKYGGSIAKVIYDD